MKIQKLDTHSLRNDAHFQFHTEFRDLVTHHGAATLKIKPQFDDYLPLYNCFRTTDIVMKLIAKYAVKHHHHHNHANSKQDSQNNNNSQNGGSI